VPFGPQKLKIFRAHPFQCMYFYGHDRPLIV
jgi:hypothetical protein